MSNFGAISYFQYAAGDSFIHRLDPRSKYSFAVSFTATFFSSHSLVTCAVCIVIVIFLYQLSKLRLLYVWRSIRVIVVILFIFGLMQAGVNGIEAAALTTLKVLTFFLIITLMMSTTPPEKQIEGLRKLLIPLRRFGMKTESFLFMFTAAIMYIPLLLEDMMQLMQAQKVRGFHDGGWKFARTGKEMFLLLTPLLLVIFRRAERLSEAMESRCYRPGCERSSYYQMKIEKHDVIVFILAFLFPFIFLFL